MISFASKYCSWICLVNLPNEDKSYPIYDRYSRGMIWEIRKKYLGKTEKKSLYYDYMYFFEAFIDAHGMFASELGYRDFDKYLWSYGKEKGFSME